MGKKGHKGLLRVDRRKVKAFASSQRDSTGIERSRADRQKWELSEARKGTVADFGKTTEKKGNVGGEDGSWAENDGNEAEGGEGENERPK